MKNLLILKALSDESRLSIFRLLLERDSYSEVIAERLNLAPSTVSFHLKKLTDAGLVTSFRDQYYTIYKANPQIADMSIKEFILNADIKSPVLNEDKVREKSLKSFFKYGKLVKIPSQKMKRLLVLEKVARSFQTSKAYTRQEALNILEELYPDPALLLKELLQSELLKINEEKIWRPQDLR